MTKETTPTRSLFDTGPKKHRWVPSVSTDIRKTFEKFRRLERMKQTTAREPHPQGSEG